MGGHAACGDLGWAGGRPDSRQAAGRRPGVHRLVRPCLHRQTYRGSRRAAFQTISVEFKSLLYAPKYPLPENNATISREEKATQTFFDGKPVSSFTSFALLSP